MSALAVRAVAASDATAIAAIYGHHVLHGTATFDTDPPDAAFWRDKIAALAERGWPFVVAEAEGGVIGYAYATQFRDRPAYREACEDSIYVAPDAIGRGVGRALLTVLVERAAAAGFREMLAVIGGAEPASVALHARLGFVETGRMRNVGIKFGRRLDTLYMQRSLAG
ncbi:N-acetyltransferase family protein [Sphingomonas sp. AR_OL41]|uniref:GNAT family N-acetyltransferase n=1 Tax=Sphingomonas sp. AR_OL41 TaxID=3042729 RepID=UPI002480FA9A|nr:GNAT family N-acetyltransferase [Sphingomonas sp. AR_OL41]MDH7974423.1 N-acetyltransferase family protein [Sphingomonas sp. AR_OL41]